MKRLLEHRHKVRHNLLAIIGFCLCFYFTYHALLGERSYLRLVSVERKIERLNTQYADLNAQRETLEHKVVMMRPGSLDRDLLEERARIVLGYRHPDEILIIQN